MSHAVRFRRRVHGREEWLAIDAADGTTLFESARRLGLPVASACGTRALCARCGFEVLSGADGLSAEDGAEAEAKRRNRIPADWRLSCRARVHGPVSATARYW